MVALGHLDLWTALRFNPVAPLIVALISAIGLRSIYLMARDGNVQALGDAPYGAWIVKLLVVGLGLQVLVWALRFLGLFGGPCPV